MKKSILISLGSSLLLLVICLSIFSSCVEAETSYGDLSLTIAPDALCNSRSILPSGNEPLAIHSYQISAQGPFETLINETVLVETEVLIENLQVGYWDFTVTAFNASGTALIKGTAQILIRREHNSALIILDQLIGSGTVEVNFSWSATQAPPEATLKVLLLPVEGERQTLEVTKTESGAKLNTTLQAGYYTLVYQLYLDEELLGGGSEALRVIDDTISGGDIEVIIGQVADEYTLTILNSSLLPLNGTMLLSPETLTKGQPFTLTFTPVWEEDISPHTLLVKWYCDGTLLVDATTLTLTVGEALAGSHRYDIVLFDATWGPLGSASALVEIATPIVILPIGDL